MNYGIPPSRIGYLRIRIDADKYSEILGTDKYEEIIIEENDSLFLFYGKESKYNITCITMKTVDVKITATPEELEAEEIFGNLSGTTQKAWDFKDGKAKVEKEYDDTFHWVIPIQYLEIIPKTKPKLPKKEPSPEFKKRQKVSWKP